MPLTEKGKKIKKAMEKQYGKKKAEKIFYASKNAGKITGVEKKMKVKKASLGLLIGSQADKVMRKSKGARKAAGSGMFGLTGLAASKYYEKKKGGVIQKAKSGKYFEMLGVKPTVNKKTLTPKSIETKPDKKGGDIFIKLAKSKLGFNGGGIAVKGTKFKGVF